MLQFFNSLTARPGPEEPARHRVSARARAEMVAGRADWLAGKDMDEAFAEVSPFYQAGYEAEILDCIDTMGGFRG